MSKLQAKWDKIKEIIKGQLEEFELAHVPVVLFDHKQLEKDSCFMVHMVMLYIDVPSFHRYFEKCGGMTYKPRIQHHHSIHFVSRRHHSDMAKEISC